MRPEQKDLRRLLRPDPEIPGPELSALGRALNQYRYLLYQQGHPASTAAIRHARTQAETALAEYAQVAGRPAQDWLRRAFIDFARELGPLPPGTGREAAATALPETFLRAWRQHLQEAPGDDQGLRDDVREDPPLRVARNGTLSLHTVQQHIRSRLQQLSAQVEAEAWETLRWQDCDALTALVRALEAGQREQQEVSGEAHA